MTSQDWNEIMEANEKIYNSRKIALEYKKQFEKLWCGSYVDECKYKDRGRLEKVECLKK